MDTDEIGDLLRDIDALQSQHRLLHAAIAYREGCTLMVYAWCALLAYAFWHTGGLHRLHPTGADLLFFVYLSWVLK
jgi:hypothetical protein